LIEALDLPRREFAREEEIEFREHKLDPAERGRRNYAKGKRFEDEVATLYRLLGFETKQDVELSGVQIDLMIQQKLGGASIEFIVECKGKSTLARFLVYNLAQNYLKDPVRHPAPVLIPLGEVRKETSLEGIIHEHFSRRNAPSVNFRQFAHLARLGKIILFFDAFDEMADRVSYEDGFSNFREISRAAEAAGKVIVTCRVTYFKDVDEQREMIDEAYRAPGTPFYEKLRERSGNEVVYLKSFDEAKIRSYLAVARAKPDEDWAKIEQIYDLKGLAQLPLLLTMITDSLDEFAPGEKVDAAKLYERYTDNQREHA